MHTDICIHVASYRLHKENLSTVQKLCCPSDDPNVCILESGLSYSLWMCVNCVWFFRVGWVEWGSLCSCLFLSMSNCWMIHNLDNVHTSQVRFVSLSEKSKRLIYLQDQRTVWGAGCATSFFTCNKNTKSWWCEMNPFWLSWILQALIYWLLTPDNNCKQFHAYSYSSAAASAYFSLSSSSESLSSSSSSESSSSASLY